jgi:hypothetical protein
MKTFSVLILAFALAYVARGDTQNKKQPTQAKASQHVATKPSQHVPTKPPQHVATHSEHPTGSSAHVQHTQAIQHVAPPGGHPAQVPTGGHPAQVGPPAPLGPQKSRPQTAAAVQPVAPPLTKEQQEEMHAQGQGFRSAEQYRKWKETGRIETPAGVVMSGAPNGHSVTAAGTGATGAHPGVHPFPSRHFDLPNTPVPKNENVKFQAGNHIPECEKWRDSRYDAFRNYTATWRGRDWWRSHHSRIVFVCGGWYYWHARHWFPAWGYQPDAAYVYDGPIYAYNNLEPDQVVANVQAALKELGYYQGPINGVLESETRAAVANYQRDHGLYNTSAIDEPTLASLGMA